MLGGKLNSCLRVVKTDSKSLRWKQLVANILAAIAY